MHTSEKLIIGVSSRSLFNLEEENKIFETQGMEAFREYQYAHENELLAKGTAFYLVQQILELNKLTPEPMVEVVIMSRNSPETGMRVLNAVKTYKLPIERMAFSGGEPLAPYIDAFGVDLFLTMDEKDVQTVVDSGKCAAASIYAPPVDFNSDDTRVKIAFDADAVLFSEESEYRYKTEGLEAFQRFEEEHEDVPLGRGPFANLLIKLSRLQQKLPLDGTRTALRIAIVTARSAPSHLRVIRTLREWGVHVDEAYFLGGRPKSQVLEAFGAHIFFDDQEVHLEHVRNKVPSGKVHYSSDSPMKKLKP
jgi:5'-nucleotidase